AAPPSWPSRSPAWPGRSAGSPPGRPAPPGPRAPPRCALIPRPAGRAPAASPPPPRAVGPPRRDVTALIQGTEGLIAKDGAESVHAVGLTDGRGVALKIADGAQRARPGGLPAGLPRP